MKDIKFRAWDKENRTWTFVTLGDLVCGACLSSGDKPLSGFPQVWEQSTGLKDNNGKEIYEGDIVRCWNGLDYSDGSVKWSENSAVYFVKYFEKKDGFDEDDWLCDCYCEVIGNIHENPELLTE